MKYALIGCGRISPKHIDAAKNNGLEIVALCDTDGDMAAEKKRKAQLPDSVGLYTDYRSMLAAEKPELVAVATESGKHAAVAIDCINAGCNVIIEKPVALSLADADAVIAAGRRAGVTVCANHQKRFNKAVRHIRRAVEDGSFGRLLYGTARTCWHRGSDYYSQAAWRGTWEQDGGALMNQSIHNIDLLCWMLGNEPEEVFSYTDNLNHPYIQAEDMGIALVKFRNGSYGIIEGTTDVNPRSLEETLCLFGERGTVRAGGKSVNTIEEWMFAGGADEADAVKADCLENAADVYGLGHTPLYADVIDAVRTGRQPYVTAEDGRRALELVLAIYKSAAEGRPVRLPLADCSTLDFTGRFGG